MTQNRAPLNIADTIRIKLKNDPKGADWSGFSDDDSLLGKGILSSMGMVELLSFLEEAFDIRVKEDELSPENFDSINRISAYVSGKLNAIPK